jgi:hypothetical protein
MSEITAYAIYVHIIIAIRLSDKNITSIILIVLRNSLISNIFSVLIARNHRKIIFII